MSSQCLNCNPSSFPCNKVGEIATGSASVNTVSVSESVSSSAGASSG